jgi:Helix-turn-helix domain
MGEDERDIVIEDEAWAQGFTQIPNCVLRNRVLSMGAKLAYGILLSYAWQDKSCFPGHERMAEDIGCSVRSVIAYLKELDEEHVIAITRRGQGRTNLYRLPRLYGDPRQP